MRLDPIDKMSARISELEDERDIFKRTLDKRDAEVAELRSRYLGIDKTHELVEQGRKETAQEICEMITETYPELVGDCLVQLPCFTTTEELAEAIKQKYGIEEEGE